METEVLFEKETLPYPLGSPRDFLTALFRQKKTIFLTFIVLFVGAAAWINSQKTLYDAHATLVLKFGREQIFRPEVGQKSQIVRHDQAGAVESERKIIQSRDLVRRVVADMGVENLYPELINPSKRNPQREIENATSKFLGNLESFADKGKVIGIAFSHQKPEVAAMALNVLIEELKEKHLKMTVIKYGNNIKFEAIGFNMYDFEDIISKNKVFKMAYKIEENNFLDKKTLNLNVKDIKPM